jgi:copper oxidase (laccase) domain-containing protein
VTLFRWDAPGPYRVAFSTRVGGVSEGPFESLNLGILTGDDPASVVENRRRLCAELGIDPGQARMAWQQHGARVREAAPEGVVAPGTVHVPCDGFWSDEPGQGMLLVTADCLPVAIARANGPRPALAVLHVGWKGLLEGIVANGVGALADGGLAAAIGPGIGPCCYEVREDVAGPFRIRFGAQVLRGGKLDPKRPDASARTSRGAHSGDVHGALSAKRAPVISVRTSPGLMTKTGIRPASCAASVSPRRATAALLAP